MAFAFKIRSVSSLYFAKPFVSPFFILIVIVFSFAVGPSEIKRTTSILVFGSALVRVSLITDTLLFIKLF